MSFLMTLTEFGKPRTDGALLNADTGRKIAEWERQKKKLDALENELRSEIQLEMEQRGIVKASCEYITVTYIPTTQKEMFDVKTFRKDNPEIYQQYAKYSPVKASIRIKLNGEQKDGN